MLEFFVRLQSLMTVQREKGATAVEYGLMVALIAMAIVVTVGLLGGGLDALFADVLDIIDGNAPAAPNP